MGAQQPMIAEKPVARLAPAAASALSVEEQIRQRAYQLYEQRGCEHGHDVEDWLMAERELGGEGGAAGGLTGGRRQRRDERSPE